MKPPTNNPAPHALEIARAVQQKVAPDTVILFGSRAAGDHRQDSDVDLLLITQEKYPPKNRPSPTAAANEYMKTHPPLLEINIKTMSASEFARNRKAKQHIAGQAEHHGVVMNGETLEYPSGHAPNTRYTGPPPKNA